MNREFVPLAGLSAAGVAVSVPRMSPCPGTTVRHRTKDRSTAMNRRFRRAAGAIDRAPYNPFRSCRDVKSIIGSPRILTKRSNRPQALVTSRAPKPRRNDHIHCANCRPRGLLAELYNRARVFESEEKNETIKRSNQIAGRPKILFCRKSNCRSISTQMPSIRYRTLQTRTVERFHPSRLLHESGNRIGGISSRLVRKVPRLGLAQRCREKSA